jgi:acetoin utilization deacetylase AcuC-like enzyme
VAVLFATHPRYLDHVAGRGHPERPARLEAVLMGARCAGLDDALVPLEPRPATREELERVHPAAYLDAMDRFCQAGGGRIDADTGAIAASWDAAVLAAGAGVSAVEALDGGDDAAAFCAVRPPGHHATAARAMGFCLLNNVAVTAAHLAARGERVAVVDYDAHHGNGTQEFFYDDARVAYVSLHEWPLYPGTGRLDEVGADAGVGATCNVPLPAGATGDLYLRAVDELVAPLAARHAPDWVLVSCGFDAHRADPLTGLGLSAGDYGALATRMAQLATRPGRVIVFLEGGYDLGALRDGTASTVTALAGETVAPVEPPTSGGPGREVVDAAADLWREVAEARS